jgi:hypothetical protein
MNDNFAYKDMVTGQKMRNPLNKTILPKEELDAIFNDWWLI